MQIAGRLRTATDPCRYPSGREGSWPRAACERQSPAHNPAWAGDMDGRSAHSNDNQSQSFVNLRLSSNRLRAPPGREEQHPNGHDEYCNYFQTHAKHIGPPSHASFRRPTPGRTAGHLSRLPADLSSSLSRSATGQRPVPSGAAAFSRGEERGSAKMGISKAGVFGRLDRGVGRVTPRFGAPTRDKRARGTYGHHAVGSGRETSGVQLPFTSHAGRRTGRHGRCLRAQKVGAHRRVRATALTVPQGRRLGPSAAPS